jgi:hypothetical protein
MSFSETVKKHLRELFPWASIDRDKLDRLLTAFQREKVKRPATVGCRVYLSDDSGNAIISVSGPRDVLHGRFPGWTDRSHTRVVMVPEGIADPKSFVQVKATRSRLRMVDGKEVAEPRDVKVTLRVNWKPGLNREWLSIGVSHAGVTGYEFCRCDEQFVRATSEIGWLACAGTAGCWDKLSIPADQMRRAFDHFAEYRGERWMVTPEEWAIDKMTREFEVHVEPERRVIEL